MAIESGTVLVSPRELLEKAEFAYAKIDVCEDLIARISKVIRATDSFWQGEAGTAAREAGNPIISNAKKSLEELKGYPKDLLAYQGIYSEVIARTEQLANDVDGFTMV